MRDCSACRLRQFERRSRLLEAREGYVAVRARRGYCVAVRRGGRRGAVRAPPSLGDPPSLEAARRMTLADLDALKVLNHDFLAALKSRSRPSLQEKNFRFHFRLYGIAGQPQTMDFVRMLSGQISTGNADEDARTAITGGPGTRGGLSTLERNDPEGAVAAMQVHIKTGVGRNLSRIIARPVGALTASARSASSDVEAALQGWGDPRIRLARPFARSVHRRRDGAFPSHGLLTKSVIS